MKEVEAAGGVLVRRLGAGRVEVALVHRPRYDDWSLPKGKADPGESPAETALREVEEETGFVCELGREVGVVRYRDRYDRPKVVHYFLMNVADGSFTPNHEVDELHWCSPADAVILLTYAHDRELVDGIEELR